MVQRPVSIRGIGRFHVTRAGCHSSPRNGALAGAIGAVYIALLPTWIVEGEARCDHLEDEGRPDERRSAREQFTSAINTGAS